MSRIVPGSGKELLRQLSRHCRIRRIDIGSDAHLSGKMFVFDTQVYEIAEVGHLCIMKMRSVLGLMRMETVILASMKKDMPLMNMDRVRLPFKETLLLELYDTQIAPWPEESQKAFSGICDRNRDLPGYSAGAEHWYDSILYPCSFQKSGRGITSRLDAAAHDFSALFVRQLADAPSCDYEEKKSLVLNFAERLASGGGSAVTMFTKLFGPDTARRMIIHHMYGV